MSPVKSLNPFAVCNFQDESCIESFVTVEEASITSEALSLDNTLSNSYPNVISILDDQQAGLSSPNGNSTTVDEIGTGIDQNYSPSTMPPSFDDQLKEYRTKHSHTDRMIDVLDNSGITHQKTTRKSTRNRKNARSSQVKSKRCNYIPQPISPGDFNKTLLPLLQSAVKVFQLKPVVDFPTRGDRTLDQIFTNLTEYFSPPYSLPAFGLSDHQTIFISARIRDKTSKPKRKLIATRDKRPSKIASVGRFLQQIHESDQPWMNTNLKQLISRRQKAFTSGNNPLYKILRNKVNQACKRCRKSYYVTKVKGLRDSKPRDWWREVKQICGASKIPKRDLISLLHPNLVCDKESLAENINSAFANIMNDYLPLSDCIRVEMADDRPISVTEHSVARKLLELNASRASGPDNLPNWVLKNFAYILAAPIADILNTSFLECKVPDAWKLANVCPLPKASSICNINKDLRPISLTPTLSKVAESFIIDIALKPVLLPIIDPGQFGFIPGSSTTLALISMFHQWLRATDSTASTVRTILLDFRKAFDLVDHNILVAKLFRVPQGTRLGPWLFLVLINDLKLSHKSLPMWKIADDCTISEVIPPSKQSSLQQAVDYIDAWSQENRLQLKPTKCKEVRSCFKRNPPSFPLVELNDFQLERVSVAKILGVTIRDDFKWNDHIGIVTVKAAKRLYLLRQLKRAGICPKDLITFYCSAIRSLLEYSCQLFHRSLPKYLSNELESIQWRAMRIIHPDLKYADALKDAGICTLFDRRAQLSTHLFEDIVNNPNHKLSGLLPPQAHHHNDLRSERRFNVPVCYYTRFFRLRHIFEISYGMAEHFFGPIGRWTSFLSESIITRSASHCSSKPPTRTLLRLKWNRTGLCNVYVSCFFNHDRCSGFGSSEIYYGELFVENSHNNKLCLRLNGPLVESLARLDSCCFHYIIKTCKSKLENSAEKQRTRIFT
ncbi:RNA-directed DNA polymerase from mobile element jockey, partial [Paramuricea clavata]